MDVVLDTNPFRASGLDGAAFGSLREYLSKTKSRLLLHSVVIEELCAQRRAEIIEAVRKVASGKKDLTRLLTGFSLEVPDVDIEAAVQSYRLELEGSAGQVEIIEISLADSKELVRRLANRVPPASAKGEEARDVLLWLAVVSVGQRQETAFISRDQRAFFHEGSLKRELEDDLKKFNSKISAYEGLESFLKAHHRRSSWVDEQWLAEQIESPLVDDAIEAYMRGRETLFVRSSIGGRGAPTGYASFLQVVHRDLREFFVSDMTAGALFVGVTLWAELEFEVEYEPFLSDWRDRRGEKAVTWRFEHPAVVMQLELEVIGREVKSVTVADIERD